MQQRRDGVLGTAGGDERAAHVAGERADLAVGGVAQGLRIGGCRTVELAELHVGVADHVVDGTCSLAVLLGVGEVGDGGEPITGLVCLLASFECLSIHG